MPDETIERNTVRFERDGHVGRLTLNRPGKLNAFSIEMWRELGEVGEELLVHPELRALVVTGEGRAFSSGIDTSVFVEGGLGESLEGMGTRHDDPVADLTMAAQATYSWLADAPFATIAAVRGYAFGAGLQLAAACDLRVFARGTKVGLLELQYGIMPDLGGTQRIPHLIGPARTKLLILTGARIEAEEAFRIGLCERLVDDDVLDAEAGALAATIASQPPLAIRGTKRSVAAAFDLRIEEGLRVEAEQQSVCLTSDDMREAIAAFVEQRPPRYQGR